MRGYFCVWNRLSNAIRILGSDYSRRSAHLTWAPPRGLCVRTYILAILGVSWIVPINKLHDDIFKRLVQRADSFMKKWWFVKRKDDPCWVEWLKSRVEARATSGRAGTINNKADRQEWVVINSIASSKDRLTLNLAQSCLITFKMTHFEQSNHCQTWRWG